MTERDWLTALEQALGEQDAALRRGAFDALGPLADRLAGLAARGPAAPPPTPAQLERLRARAARSAALLGAARNGVAAARARAAAVLGGGATLRTYGADGRLVAHDGADRVQARRLERRA